MTDGRAPAKGVKERIEAFLAAHPAACDTVDGIGAFWVPGARRDELRAALEALVAEGLVARVTVGGRDHYVCAAYDGRRACS